MEDIIQQILIPNCPPSIGGSLLWSGGYGSTIMNGPMYPSWGSNPCQIQKLQVILSQLNALLSPLDRDMQLRILNTPVIAIVHNQGRTDNTILEAAIVMRWPGLVAQLLIMGASPNVTTSGISLVAQLYEALPLDYTQGLGGDTQAIIDLLLQSGSYVPPGFPGTQGYLPSLIRGERRYRHRNIY